MAEFVYICCTIISIFCTFLLFKNYGQNRARLLLWLGVAFAFLTVNNIFTCVDVILLPEVDMAGHIVRNFLFSLSGIILATGLIWEFS